jgi:type VI secretion system protein ImpC
MRLLPQAGTGDEADLWLSDLVESRSGAGFAFRATVRAQLREALRQDGDALQRVWQTVHAEHSPWLSPRARLEEKLTWLLLRDAADPAIELLWAGVVRELEGADNAEGVARWVVRAVPELPPGTLDHPSGRLAFHGAHLLLGDASVLGSGPQRFLDGAQFAFATRRLPRRDVHVGLAHDRLLLSPLLPIDNGHLIDVPATRPLWFQIEADPPMNVSPEVVTLADDAPLVHSLGLAQLNADAIRLRLIDGSLFILRPGRAKGEFQSRTRPPRVQLEYDVEVYGTPKKVYLPFVVGVLADLSGDPAEPLPPVENRKFREVDVDRFDTLMKSMRPRVAFQVPEFPTGEGNIGVDITFEGMDDFSPAAVVRKVDVLNQMLEARERLSNLLTAMDGKLDAEELIGEVLKNNSLLEALATGMSSPPAENSSPEVNEFRALRWQVFKPKTEEARFHIEKAMQALARQVLAQPAFIGADVFATIQTIIKDLDRKLSGQLNLILHHGSFQKLEGAWRGLHYLVSNTETNQELKIRVLNISKSALGETLTRFRDTAWDQSPIFKLVYESEFGALGGEPFGCLVGDYVFDHSQSDVELLGDMARVAAAAHAPFITGASPTVMHMDSWQEISNPRDLTQIFSSSEYEGWRSLRADENSRYIGLAMPRFLSRLPYGNKTNPVEEFEFEEDIGDMDHSKYTWANSAYAMAVNINRSFKTYGWVARIRGMESGGAVEGLPTHVYPADDGSVDMNCPTEIAINDRREAELATQGFMTLLHRKNSDVAVFISAQSLQKPRAYEDPDTTVNARLAARLPYLFACCRFAHYLKCMVRDRVGSFTEREDMERWLTNWLLQYVDADPANSPETTKARRPLAAANVKLQDVEGNPHYCTLVLDLQPHYQLEGLTAPLRLVSTVPSPIVA